MHRLTAQTCALASSILLNVSCGTDNSGEEHGAGAGGQASAGVGASAGIGASAGVGGLGGQASGTAGATPGGAGGAGAAAGGSGPANAGAAAFTPETLLTATYAECSKGCALVASACPTTNASNCTEGCNSQADSYFDSGKCGLEFYEVWACINSTLGTSDITCPMTSSGRPMFKGCTAEQLRYTSCM